MVVLWIILFDGFHIKYKQESEIDLKKSMEVTLLRITRSAKYDCKTRGF
jgi:hypothetical protein